MSDPPSLRAKKIVHRLAEERQIGDVVVVPAPSTLRGADNSFVAGLLETAFLVATADGEIRADEVAALTEIVSAAIGDALSHEDLEVAMQTFGVSMEREGRQSRIDAVAHALTSERERTQALAFAIGIALADHELAPSELFVLHSLGKAFGIGTKEVNALLATIRGGLPTP